MWITIKANKIITVMAVLTFALAPLTASASDSQEIKKPYALTGNEATITGTIHFEGEVPKLWEIDMGADEECVRSHSNPVLEDLIVTNGRLANVLIYVKSNVLDKYSYESPKSPVMIERQGCQIIPRVLGIQTDKPFLVFNNSRTAHNTNVQPVVNPKWNKSQPVGAPPIEYKFSYPEKLVIVKDNQHPWEKAYIGVFSHPFFIVTERDGFYTIAGLPPGQYTLVAWHEKFGEKISEVTVAAKESKNIDFTFTLEKK